MTTLSKNAILRIAKTAGAERVSYDAVDMLANLAEKYVETISHDAFKISKHTGRKTLKCKDIELLLSQKE